MARVLPLLLIAVTVFLQSPPCPGEDDLAPPMYQRQASLQQTLQATRHKYAEWNAGQPAVRKLVELGPWSGSPVLSAGEADQAVQPGKAIAPDAKLADGRLLWGDPKLPDGKTARFVSGGSDRAVYLARSIQAKEACRLTIGIGGGDRLDVWLAGQKLAAADTHLNVGRYGCSTRVDGTRVDQLLVDLPLVAGENTLLVRLTPGSEPSFYFSITPNPAPRLWEQVRRDFPAKQNPLLDRIHADWFAPNGWLAATDCRFERQFLERSLGDCGVSEKAVRLAFQQLQQQEIAPSDKQWLDLCVRVSVLAELQAGVTGLRAAVEELSLSHDGYPAEQFLAKLDDYTKRVTASGSNLDPANDATRHLMAEMPKMQRQMLVDENPLLKNEKLLFVKRYTYNSKHYYDDFQHVSRWGGNLCELSLSDGKVREIAPELTGGVFDRYDLSFDGKRILFGYRRPKLEGYRIYEIGVDGTGLRQVTHPPENEEERIATYGKTSTGDGFYGLLGYRFWTDDVHPCYLPDGGLCFSSTRSEHGVLCTPNHYLACTNLFRMEMDGTGLRPLSRGALSEFTPTVMDDGRILYNRWEYVYKGIAGVQPLWTMRPDGSGSEEFYGDNITNPGVLWQARQLPGTPGKAVCIGCGHEPFGIGQVLLLNPGKSKRTPESMTSLTPNVETRGLRGLYQRRNGVQREDIFGPFYADPYPLSDKFFLVACNADQRYNDEDAYDICLLDTFGNRVPIYDDPEFSCWLPMPLRARKVPPVLPSLPRPNRETKPETATLFVSDVYRGLDGVEPGTVKYLRVMEQIPKPWSAEVDPLRNQDRRADGFGGHIAVSHNAHIWIAVLRGIVPVEADGSAVFEVPAGKNLFLQALDEDFMQVQRMRTFVNLEPGETRSCIGCHEHRTQAPPTRMVSAMKLVPAKLGPQPGEVAPRPLHYPSDVQPILDRHCAECHNGKDPKAAPDLRGEMTTIFNRSYENLMQAGWVDTIREWNGASYSMENVESVPPYTHGSHASKLVKLLRDGHYDAKLSQEEWVKLVTWIDCGAPYYGSYYGRRNLRYLGQPDFRPVPTVESACGIRPEFAELAKAEPIPAELLAWWKLDDASAGMVRDASRAGHEMKVVAATPTEGHDGSGGVRFDGTAYLESSGLGAHDAISIALWVKADSLDRRWNPLLFCNDIQPGTVHFSLLPDGTPNVAINTGSDWTHCTAGASMPAGEWHHVALVCDARFGGRAVFYLDGRPIGDEFLSLGMPLDLYGFRIGGWNRWEKTPNDNFHGEVDELRIYRGTLTEEQVLSLAKDEP